MVKKKKIKKALQAIGLGTLLTYNGIEIDKKKFAQAQSALFEFFDGDDKKALLFTKEQYEKIIDETIGEDDNEKNEHN